MTRETHIPLFITSGSGPAECHLAVAGVLDVIRDEAEMFAVGLDVSGASTKYGLKSAVVLLCGPDVETFAKRWRGTIQWRSKSALRPQNKRANWFIGIFDLPKPSQTPARLHERDVVFESFRAGGPGGQHQNTTDSAVRAKHKPTGITVVAREERSQHRNKSLAMERLHRLMVAQAIADQEARKAVHNKLHHVLERGNPVRCFKGRDFSEDREV